MSTLEKGRLGEISYYLTYNLLIEQFCVKKKKKKTLNIYNQICRTLAAMKNSLLAP